MSHAFAAQLKVAAKKYSLEMQSEVNEVLVAKTVADTAGLPLDTVAGHLSGAFAARVFNLESFLKKAVVGQNEAVDRIAKRVLISSGVQGDKSARPVIFMFAGPKGVGKTRLAKQLAKGLFGEDKEPVLFDMSVNRNVAAIKKIFGGAEQQSLLMSALGGNPFNAVIFESVENAAQDFYENFSAFIDNKDINKDIDLSATIFVLTTSFFSGPGEKSLSEENLSPGKMPQSFAAQLSDIIVFKPLSDSAGTRILLGWLEEIRQQMNRDYGVELSIGRDVEKHLLETGLSNEYGVRHLKAVFQEKISNPIEELCKDGRIKAHGQWQFSITNGKVLLKPREGGTVLSDI